MMIATQGSTVGRQISEEQRARGAVRKDLDLVNDGVRLKFGGNKDAFLAQLEKDAQFLASLNIMDYSLLVGIHDRQQGGAPHMTRSNTPFRRHSEVLEPREPGAATTTETFAAQSTTRMRLHSASTHNSHEPSDTSDHGPRIVREPFTKSTDTSGAYQHDDELKMAFDEQSEYTELELEEEYPIEEDYGTWCWPLRHRW